MMGCIIALVMMGHTDNEVAGALFGVYLAKFKPEEMSERASPIICRAQMGTHESRSRQVGGRREVSRELRLEATAMLKKTEPERRYDAIPDIPSNLHGYVWIFSVDTEYVRPLDEDEVPEKHNNVVSYQVAVMNPLIGRYDATIVYPKGPLRAQRLSLSQFLTHAISFAQDMGVIRLSEEAYKSTIRVNLVCHFSRADLFGFADIGRLKRNSMSCAAPTSPSKIPASPKSCWSAARCSGFRLPDGYDPVGTGRQSQPRGPWRQHELPKGDASRCDRRAR